MYCSIVPLIPLVKSSWKSKTSLRRDVRLREPGDSKRCRYHPHLCCILCFGWGPRPLKLVAFCSQLPETCKQCRNTWMATPTSWRTGPCSSQTCCTSLHEMAIQRL